MSSSGDEQTPPLAGKVIPVLRDVIAPASGLPLDTEGLSAEQSTALAAEARVILEELMGEVLPAIEAQLRERLQQRITAMLGG